MSLLLCDLDESLVDRSAVFSGRADQFARIRDQDEAIVYWTVSDDRSEYRPKTEFFGVHRASAG